MASPVVNDLTGHAPVTRGRGHLSWLPALVVVTLACYLASELQTGADTMWMVALGDRIASTGSIPIGIPFAAADTSGWPNVPVVGELTMFAIHSLGPASLAVRLATARRILSAHLGAHRSARAPLIRQRSRQRSP